MTQFSITQPVLVIVGPTAIGKTALSLELARVFNCEIVNMDSMQVYRYMDIGTAKATKEERGSIPHHLIDITDPDQEYDAERLSLIPARQYMISMPEKRTPLLTGGTGLYLRALTEGLFAGGKQYPELRDRLKVRLALEGSSNLHKELMVYDRISAERIHENDTHRLIRALGDILWFRHSLVKTSPSPSKRKNITSVCKYLADWSGLRQKSSLLIALIIVAEVCSMRVWNKR